MHTVSPVLWMPAMFLHRRDVSFQNIYSDLDIKDMTKQCGNDSSAN